MTTYFGPYVCCRTSKIQSSAKINTCSYETCEEYPNKVWSKERKFCNKCGSPIQNREVTVEIDNVNYSNLQEKILEALCVVPGDNFHFWMRDNNSHIWIANRRNPNARNYFGAIPEHMSHPINVTAKLITDDLEEFRKFYNKELDVLNKNYGEENVDVQYGIINYF